MLMAGTLDDILPSIVNAKDAGVTQARIKTRLAKRYHGQLQEKLKSLVDAEEIRGPVKHAGSIYYFVSGRGPSAKAACIIVSNLVLNSGIRLLSHAALKKKVTGMNAKFFSDGLQHAIEDKRIIRLACGKSKYYLHRRVAEEHFLASDPSLNKSPDKPTAQPELTMETVRPIFRQLKAEQGGLGTIDIYDLMKSLHVSKEALHQFLLKETKVGHLTIHPTTTVTLKPEVIDAGIRLPGFSEPFVTVALKDDS